MILSQREDGQRKTHMLGFQVPKRQWFCRRILCSCWPSLEAGSQEFHTLSACDLMEYERSNQNLLTWWYLYPQANFQALCLYGWCSFNACTWALKLPGEYSQLIFLLWNDHILMTSNLHTILHQDSIQESGKYASDHETSHTSWECSYAWDCCGSQSLVSAKFKH